METLLGQRPDVMVVVFDGRLSLYVVWGMSVVYLYISFSNFAFCAHSFTRRKEVILVVLEEIFVLLFL